MKSSCYLDEVLMFVIIFCLEGRKRERVVLLQRPVLWQKEIKKEKKIARR